MSEYTQEKRMTNKFKKNFIIMMDLIDIYLNEDISC